MTAFEVPEMQEIKQQSNMLPVSQPPEKNATEPRVEKKPTGSSEMVCNSLWVKGFLVGIGALLLLVGLILGFFWPTLLNSILKKELALTPDSKSFSMWKETPLPLYIDFYMFNWTNPEETLIKGVKPHFVEMGPYVFREYHTKVKLKWNENDTITFQQVRKWHFEKSLSNGSLSDQVTNINVIAMTIAAMVKKYVPSGMLPVVDSLISIKEKPYVTKSVGELLFYGYKDPLLSIVAKIRVLIKDINIPFDKFGWFYGRNMSDTYDGIFNMHTGTDDINLVGNLHAWNYTTKTKFFRNKCSQISGTTGELWPLNSASGDSANIFASDICSSLILTDKTKGVQVEGQTGTKFAGKGDVFVGNSCYCINRRCPLDGVREISTCRYGAPAYVSFPHFYLADHHYNRAVTGLKPNADLHSFFIVLEEETGVPLEINARLQVNILSDPLPGLTIFRKLPKAMMPMIWFNQHATITSDLGSQLSTIRVVDEMALPLLFSIAGIGLLLVAAGLILILRGHFRKNSDSERLIPSNNPRSS